MTAARQTAIATAAGLTLGWIAFQPLVTCMLPVDAILDAGKFQETLTAHTYFALWFAALGAVLSVCTRLTASTAITAALAASAIMSAQVLVKHNGYTYLSDTKASTGYAPPTWYALGAQQTPMLGTAVAGAVLALSMLMKHSQTAIRTAR